jgi:hypothetical protein
MALLLDQNIFLIALLSNALMCCRYAETSFKPYRTGEWKTNVFELSGGKASLS